MYYVVPEKIVTLQGIDEEFIYGFPCIVDEEDNIILHFFEDWYHNANTIEIIDDICLCLNIYSGNCDEEVDDIINKWGTSEKQEKNLEDMMRHRYKHCGNCIYSELINPLFTCTLIPRKAFREIVIDNPDWCFFKNVIKKPDMCMHCPMEGRDWDFSSDEMYYYCKINKELTGTKSGHGDNYNFIEFEEVPDWCPLGDYDEEL